MTRRLFIFRRRDPAVALPQAPPCSDMEPLNHFAALYNAYVARLQRGHLDLAAWRKLCADAAKLFT